MRKRKIGRYGNTDVIKLKPQDRKDLNLDYGDLVDIDDLVIIKEKESKKK